MSSSPPGGPVNAFSEMQGRLYIGLSGGFSYIDNAWVVVGSAGMSPSYALARTPGYLYQGGVFNTCCPTPISNIARIPEFQATVQPLADGRPIDAPVYALAALGSRVFAGGSFSRIGTEDHLRCASWTEVQGWSPMGGGTDGPVLSMFAWNNVVYVGGAFQSTGGGTGPYFARWADMASPVFTTHPLSQNGELGGVVTLTAAATVAIGTPTYSWRFNGQPVNNGPGGVTIFGGTVSGATTPSLTITGLTPLDAGEFVCVVTNGCTPVLSNPAMLYVTPTCDGDFNHDMALNGLDVEALEQVIGGAPCP